MTQCKVRIYPISTNLSHITIMHCKSGKVIDDIYATRVKEIDTNLEPVCRYISLGGTRGVIYVNASGRYYYKKSKGC